MYGDLTSEDQELINAATEVIKKNFLKPRHTVGSAVLCASGKIYAGVNVDSCGYGPCAEPIAIGMAISNGERIFKKIVAVNARPEGTFIIIAPCGNCRQLLIDYAPEIEVILPHEGKTVKTAIKNLLPAYYSNF